MFLGVQAGPGRYGWPISEWINAFMSLMNILCLEYYMPSVYLLYYKYLVPLDLVYAYLAHTCFTYVIYAYSVI